MAAILLTDADIRRLILEPKVLPPDWRRRLTRFRIPARHQMSHVRAELTLPGRDGSHFAVHVRVNRLHHGSFSVILCVLCKGEWFRLRRYNGRHWSPHRNRIERTVVTGPHIHYATERYQARGLAPDVYAEPSRRFTNVQSALDCLVRDCGFIESEMAAQGALPGI